VTFNEAAFERMLDFLRRSGRWNIADAMRDAMDMTTALLAKKSNAALSPDEESFVQLMRSFPDRVGECFGKSTLPGR
jgi:hypothetical protein